MRRARSIGLALIVVLVVAACGGGTLDLDTTTTAPPPPATAEELAAVCERYQEVENLDFGAMIEELLEVAPAELRVHIVKVLNLDEDWETNQDAVWEFLDRCDE